MASVYDDLRKAELVAFCQARGLDTDGNRADLIARLVGNDGTPVPADTPAGELPADGLVAVGGGGREITITYPIRDQILDDLAAAGLRERAAARVWERFGVVGRGARISGVGHDQVNGTTVAVTVSTRTAVTLDAGDGAPDPDRAGGDL